MGMLSLTCKCSAMQNCLLDGRDDELRYVPSYLLPAAPAPMSLIPHRAELKFPLSANPRQPWGCGPHPDDRFQHWCLSSIATTRSDLSRSCARRKRRRARRSLFFLSLFLLPCLFPSLPPPSFSLPPLFGLGNAAKISTPRWSRTEIPPPRPSFMGTASPLAAAAHR